MMFRKLAGSAGVVSVAAALMAGAGAAPAFASTWTVKPGGSFSGTSITMLTDVTSSTTITCKNIFHGSLVTGVVPTGTHLGMFGSVTYAGCNSSTWTVTASALPWWLNALSYASPVTTGKITGIHLALAGPGGCTAVMDGTSATAGNGKVTVKYSNTTAGLKLVASAGLHVWSVSAACGTLFANGDVVHYTGLIPITPHQHIVSP
jgi:hypothetical protein